jgi:hypothetical protein
MGKERVGLEMPALPEAVLGAAARLLNAGRVRQLGELTTSSRSRVVLLEANDGS